MTGRAARVLLAMVLGAFGLLLSGCWDMRTPAQYVIVSSMSVTTGEHSNYHVYLQTINSLEFASGKARGNSPTLSVDAEGNTIDEAFGRIEQRTSRKLELSHMMLLVLDTKLLATDRGILFFDFLESMKDIRNDIQIVAAHRVPASEFSKLYFSDNRVSAAKIRLGLDMVESNWGGTPNSNLKNFIQAITSEGREPVISSVTIDNPSAKSYGVDAGKRSDAPTRIITDGTAVMRRAKIVGHLNTEETRDLLLAQDQIKKTSLTVMCASRKYVQVRIESSDTRVNVRYANNRPKIRIDISVKGGISENQCQTVQLNKAAGYDTVRTLTEQTIQKHVETTIKKVQKEYGVDIFGFGEILMRSHYRTFKKVKAHWDDEFARADVTVKAEAEIMRDGTSAKSYFEDIPGMTQ